MKQGALVFNQQDERYNIRFGLTDYYGGLHCGDCLDVMINGKWKSTRIEMKMGGEWYLAGIPTNDLAGLRVRI